MRKSSEIETRTAKEAYYIYTSLAEPSLRAVERELARRGEIIGYRRIRTWAKNFNWKERLESRAKDFQKIIESREGDLNESLAVMNLRHLDGLRNAREALINTVMSRAEQQDGGYVLPDVDTDEAIRLLIAIVKSERQCTGLETGEQSEAGPKDFAEMILRFRKDHDARIEIISGNGHESESAIHSDDLRSTQQPAEHLPARS